MPDWALRDLTPFAGSFRTESGLTSMRPHARYQGPQPCSSDAHLVRTKEVRTFRSRGWTIWTRWAGRLLFTALSPRGDGGAE